jgi:hypothetical protein
MEHLLWAASKFCQVERERERELVFLFFFKEFLFVAKVDDIIHMKM